MHILVDSSVWIDYFRSGTRTSELDTLIEENIVAINEVILAEIIPPLQVRKRFKVIDQLKEVHHIPLQINWKTIRDYQVKCLKSGLNGIGIPDLLIIQNAIQNQCKIYTLDKHFYLIRKIVRVDLYSFQLLN